MEKNDSKKKVRNVAIFIILLPLVIFLILLFVNPVVSDFVVYFLIFLFLFGIVMFLLRKLFLLLFLKIGRHKKLLLVLVGLLVFSGFFYWYEVRPNAIRKNCEWLIFSKESVAYTGSRAVRQNNEFRHCLVKNGLKPESLFVNTK